MPGLNQRQRVKVNAALSMIYARGYDAQTVVTWAKEHQRKGHDQRTAYQLALNEFIGGQPDFGPVLGKVTRLIDKSDGPTVSQYDQALTTYIQTGDDSAIAALGPMIARDSVALAKQSGELAGNDINGESVEAALGFAMADQHWQAAAQAAAPPQESAQPAQQFAGWNAQAAQPEPASASPVGVGGAYVSPKAAARWAKAPSVAPGEPGSLLGGHALGNGANPSQV